MSSCSLSTLSGLETHALIYTSSLATVRSRDSCAHMCFLQTNVIMSYVVMSSCPMWSCGDCRDVVLSFACTDFCYHILFVEKKQEKIRTRDETGRKEEKKRREKDERT